MSQGLFPIRPDDHHLHPPTLLFAIHPICLVYACMRVVIGCAARAEVCSVLEAGDWHMADDIDFRIFDRGQDGTALCGRRTLFSSELSVPIQGKPEALWCSTAS
jgi:hypothetical protein